MDTNVLVYMSCGGSSLFILVCGCVESLRRRTRCNDRFGGVAISHKKRAFRLFVSSVVTERKFLSVRVRLY